MTIRLALRHEGDWWNAYLAQEGTMKDAKLIGSILIGAVAQSRFRKDTFIQLMTAVVADAIKGVTGVVPDDWEIGPAPESERSGHA